MDEKLLFFTLTFYQLFIVQCGYPPIGDEVQAGSVLLPATRRGRYLANIVRRQAVDGTGIKFNKDADRMNAEAKKKVDVLSEELLPYIIAEQERRTTLYKRVMTAIQNGEKGVTIAEIRNKPPAIIRKGIMYRCPSNRSPREPDGSGIIMCDGDIEPTMIMYESCLCAEDKDLFVSDNKYFFCNRHRIEGPDLPRNGSTVIGCAPAERTSLNYTSQKCALEDTDDVVVHYRYYPDRTYKYVMELDPDREVCEHWNPCQVGYIFSLPGPDQALPAAELWPEYTGDMDAEIIKEEMVAPIAEDDKNETAIASEDYITSTRRVPIPAGYKYDGVGKYLPNGKRVPLKGKDTRRQATSIIQSDNVEIISEVSELFVKITLHFKPFRYSDVTTYYVRFQEINKKAFIYLPMLTLNMGTTRVEYQEVTIFPGQKMNSTLIPYTCERCSIRGMMVRSNDGMVRNVEVDKYRLKKYTDEQGADQLYVEMNMGAVHPMWFGDYFMSVFADDGSLESIKALTIKAPTIDTENLLNLTRLRVSMPPGGVLDRNFKYGCKECQVDAVYCRGENAQRLQVTLIAVGSLINMHVLNYTNEFCCVYFIMFKKNATSYMSIMAITDSETPLVTTDPMVVVPPPSEGQQFEHIVKYSCTSECSVEKIDVNGVPLQLNTRRSNVGNYAFYVVENNSIAIRIVDFTTEYQGVYQAHFKSQGQNITKTVLEIGFKVDENSETIDDNCVTPAPAAGAGPPKGPEGPKA